MFTSRHHSFLKATKKKFKKQSRGKMCGVLNESLVQHMLRHSSVTCTVETSSKNQAYIDSKLRMCRGTKLEKLVQINLFYQIFDCTPSITVILPKMTPSPRYREVSQLHSDQLAPATQIISHNVPYISAFKQSNYTNCVYISLNCST